MGVLAAVQIAYAQDLFIPARQLRGSANASIPESPELPIENEPEDEPVEPEDTTDASIIEVMPEDTLPNMTSAAEAQVSAEVWGRKCTFKTWSNVCRDLNGQRILGVFAKFWSDDALKFHVEVGHMELRNGHSFCFFHGKVVKNKLTWNYHPNSWKRISYNIPKSKSSHYMKTCMRITSSASGLSTARNALSISTKSSSVIRGASGRLLDVDVQDVTVFYKSCAMA